MLKETAGPRTSKVGVKMSDSGPLMNVGELSRPATVLIEKISDAIGGYFLPWQIRRLAEAEAEAERIKARSRIEITELENRAIHRFFAEEAKKQDNMESITRKAIPEVKDDAKPEDLEEDWISQFLDKCRLVSDEEMQRLWAAVLAGEANSPGQYSKRTLSLLSSLDKGDAALFQGLCSFAWMIDGLLIPIVYDLEDSVYKDHKIHFASLTHMDSIGLISFLHTGGIRKGGLRKQIVADYYGSLFIIELPKPDDNNIEIGGVILLPAGEQLAPICGATSIPKFLDYTIEKWIAKGYKVERKDT